MMNGKFKPLVQSTKYFFGTNKSWCYPNFQIVSFPGASTIIHYPSAIEEAMTYPEKHVKCIKSDVFLGCEHLFKCNFVLIIIHPKVLTVWQNLYIEKHRTCDAISTFNLSLFLNTPFQTNST